MAEESHAKLHQTLGKVAFLRMAATRLAFETRKAFWRERTALLGKIFGSQSAYAHLKTVNAARRAVHAAVSHGEAMEKLESHLVTELTAAKVRVTLVGVTDGIPLAKDRLTGAVLELVLGELMAFAGLEADDWCGCRLGHDQRRGARRVRLPLHRGLDVTWCNSSSSPPDEWQRAERIGCAGHPG